MSIYENNNILQDLNWKPKLYNFYLLLVLIWIYER